MSKRAQPIMRELGDVQPMPIDDRSVGASASILTVFRICLGGAHLQTTISKASRPISWPSSPLKIARHLKALRWRTPDQMVCDALAKDPSVFKINPHLLTP